MGDTRVLKACQPYEYVSHVILCTCLIDGLARSGARPSANVMANIITRVWHQHSFKIRGNIQRFDVQIAFDFYRSVPIFTGHLFQTILHLQSTVLHSGIPLELWNSLTKAARGRFHGPGGHKKRNILQEKANFHRSWVWKIILIFNTTNTRRVAMFMTKDKSSCVDSSDEPYLTNTLHRWRHKTCLIRQPFIVGVKCCFLCYF